MTPEKTEPVNLGLHSGSYLQSQKERIFVEWEEKVRKLIPSVRPIDSAILRNSLPKIIDELVLSLKEPNRHFKLANNRLELGREHGEERSQFRDYDLNNVIEEYQILRQIIFSVLREKMSLTENQQDIILDAITLGIRNSTVEFVRFKQKQLEELFKKEAGAQEAVNEVKNAFLINMSHEIRTPMTAILGYIELLREPDLSQSEREDAMERIERSSRALLKLLDDILDFAKIEAGRLTNKPEIFSPAEIANDVIEVMSLTAKQKGIALKIEIDPTTPLSAWSDASRIRQILVNLIGNAIKFTKKGEVKLSVRSDSAQILFFDVQDTGIGIALEDQMKLFKAFSQADSSINRQFGGTGLGLLLSLRLAENLGGSLQLIKSIPGKGSLFRFQTRALPFNFNKLESEASSTNEKNLIDQSAKHILENKRILVVDDAVDNQLLIARFLRGAGAFVELANDGEEALKKVASLNFDLIFMDIQMPKLDGFEATKRLRSNGYEKPIVALSAHALKEEAIRSVEAGCNAHITKPISKKNLIDTVLKYTKNLDFH